MANDCFHQAVALLITFLRICGIAGGLFPLDQSRNIVQNLAVLAASYGFVPHSLEEIRSGLQHILNGRDAGMFLVELGLNAETTEVCNK